MKAVSEQFFDEGITAINAMRITSHNALLPGASFNLNRESGNESFVMEGSQCRVSATRNDTSIVFQMTPFPDKAPEFVKTKFLMDKEDFPSSPVFAITDDVSKADGHNVIKTFATLFTELMNTSSITGFMHDDRELLIIGEKLNDDRKMIMSDIENIARGCDIQNNTTPQIYLRHPGMGIGPAFLPADTNGNIQPIPSLDSKDQREKDTAARIGMMQRFGNELAQAVTVTKSDKISGAWEIRPLAMTFGPADDIQEARSKGVRSYARLAEKLRSKQ